MPFLRKDAVRRVDRSRLSARAVKLLSYYKPYLGWLTADLVCAFIVAVATLLFPLCTNIITKKILAGHVTPDTLTQIYAIGGAMLVLIAIQAVCNTFVDYQGHVMGAKMEGDMRRELFEHYQKLSFAFYDRQRTGQLMTRITQDPLSLGELFHHGPEDLAIGVIKFAGALIILVHIDPWLTLIVSLFLPFMAAYAFHFNRLMRVALRRSRDRIGDINAQVEDTLAGIRVVKSFANETVEIGKFAHENSRFLDSRRDGYRSEAWFTTGMTAFPQLITLTVIVVGAAGIVRASLDFADLVTFLLCVAILIDPVQRLLNLSRLYREGITGFERFMEVLEVEPDIRDGAGAMDLPQVRGDVEFRDVSFRYRDDASHVVRNVSLAIPAGEFVALVGASGVGKTTLCSLIPRFYEVSEGAVLLDGRDVRDIRLSALRGSIGIVQQDVYLFAGTVADNLRYGKPDASREEIVEAAKKAHAHDFIASLPHGYDSDIGQRGVILSGGQKQRLSIARVFLKNPPILIFDEATSALDNESERAVQASLEELFAQRTTLVIAHRLSTVRNARRIVVLTEQGIAEQGRHEDLMASGGAYARLYNTQARI